MTLRGGVNFIFSFEKNMRIPEKDGFKIEFEKYDTEEYDEIYDIPVDVLELVVHPFTHNEAEVRFYKTRYNVCAFAKVRYRVYIY